jgi:putative DNA methylase
MIPRECKRLIEVDFPIARVSVQAAREKSIRHGHPSTLHMWWARRPLAACRAVLLGLLLPDPGESLCPPEFKVKARQLLSQVPGTPRGLAGKAGDKKGSADDYLRKALLDFIADFANWDNSTAEVYLTAARGLITAAHPEETPIVVDPFAGGGSIPLEALRLGCEAFASDLNPVACLILKVMLEDIPRHGAALAQELRRVGAEIKVKGERELAPFYPPDPDGARPIAYLWGRTVQCEAPLCGAEIPLVRSFWLCKKANRKKALRYQVIKADNGPSQVIFDLFEPKADKEVPGGTVSRAKARCLACGSGLSPDRVRAQLAAQRGGADVIFDEQGRRRGGARLLAVVTISRDQQGRNFRLSNENDYSAIFHLIGPLNKKTSQFLQNGLTLLPNESVDKYHHDVNRLPLYGMNTWGEIFTSRQKLSMITLSEHIRNLSDKNDINKCLKELNSLAAGRVADYTSSICGWHISKQLIGNTFRRQAIPMVWDFCEINPFGDGPGNYHGAIKWISEVIDEIVKSGLKAGNTQLTDACESPLPNDSCKIIFTDPPYYDAIDYAHCSDFFFVWLKRILINNSGMLDPYDKNNPLTPKTREIVVDSTTTKGHGIRTPDFYEKSMGSAFAEGRRVLREDGIGCVVFAHKTTEGWEALLSGLLQAGWAITASWPIHTEMGSRLRAKESAALASSIHLVCRPRPKEAGVGDWAEVRAEMDRKVRTWMERLLVEGIRGADAIFACIGPALEVYSRYTRVETPAGHPVPLGGNPEAFDPQERGFLAYIFETLSREALRQVLGGADTEGFEEDARLTALFLWTLQSTRTNGNGGNGAPTSASEEAEDEEELEEEEPKPKKAKGGLALPFDVFIRLTRPMGIHYQNWEERLVTIEKGVVHLVPVMDRQEALLGEVKDFEPMALTRRSPQGTLFEMPEPEARAARPRRGPALAPEELTTLDRVHRAMLLFAGGQTLTLQRLLEEERLAGRRFERLALSLTALYPPKSQERRWLEGVQALMKTR